MAKLVADIVGTGGLGVRVPTRFVRKYTVRAQLKPSGAPEPHECCRYPENAAAWPRDRLETRFDRLEPVRIINACPRRRGKDSHRRPSEYPAQWRGISGALPGSFAGGGDRAQGPFREADGARLEGRMATLDTHAIARTLTDAGADPKLADAITAAVREAADHGDHVTPDQFKAGFAELEARLTWRFAGAMLAQTGVILAAVIGAAVTILRMLG